MNTCSAIEMIIESKAIETLYQPIVKLDTGKIIGYEALSRGPVDTEWYSPMQLIEGAEQCGLSWQLEQLMRTLAIERASKLERDQLLFINVDPHIIYDDKFESGKTKAVLEKVGLSSSQVAMELTERSAISDYEGFNKMLQNYVAQGFKIAIDDAGEGYSGINRIIETRPQFLKLDRNIIRALDEDPFKQAIVKSFVQLSMDTGIKLIAEGIETARELKALIRLGVYAGQGFYLQRPASELLKLQEDKVQTIKRYNQIANTHNAYSHHYHYIGHLSDSCRTFNSGETCKTIFNYLNEANVEATCILEEHRIAGLVTKSSVNASMGGPYGHAVYFLREIDLLMDPEPLIVDFYTPIHKVADLAMRREGEKAYHPIIVEKGDRYHGLVNVKHLVSYAMEYDRNYAKELNPLTQLPGNMVINRVLNDIFIYPGQFLVLYFDLDHFKVYNDCYGFENGDKIIQYSSKLFQSHIKGFEVINSFVGHVGGDDFVAILECYDLALAKDMIQDLLIRFDQGILNFYNEEDRQKGYIIAEDRFGVQRQFQLVSLSIAGVYGQIRALETTEKLTRYMAELKKVAKKKNGSSLELVQIPSA